MKTKIGCSHETVTTNNVPYLSFPSYLHLFVNLGYTAEIELHCAHLV